MWFRWFRRSSVLSGPIAALSIKYSKRSIPLLTFSSLFFPTSGHKNFRLVTLSSVSLSEIASNMALNLLVSMMCLNANTSNFQHYRISLFRFQLWLSLSHVSKASWKPLALCPKITQLHCCGGSARNQKWHPAANNFSSSEPDWFAVFFTSAVGFVGELFFWVDCFEMFPVQESVLNYFRAVLDSQTLGLVNVRDAKF